MTSYMVCTEMMSGRSRRRTNHPGAFDGEWPSFVNHFCIDGTIGDVIMPAVIVREGGGRVIGERRPGDAMPTQKEESALVIGAELA